MFQNKHSLSVEVNHSRQVVASKFDFKQRLSSGKNGSEIDIYTTFEKL